MWGNKCLKLSAVLSLLLTFALLTTACSQNETKSEKITLIGSTSVQPLAEELGKAYEEKNPGVQVSVHSGGSKAGIEAAQKETADIGMASRKLKDSEKGLQATEIAKDGIAVIVHPTNLVKSLTVTQVRDIFAGKITHWQELGGAEEEITVVTREVGSGTRGSFEEIVMKSGQEKARITHRALTQTGTSSVSETVAVNPSCIGYVSLGSVNSQVKVLEIDGVVPTDETVRKERYKIVHPFLFLTKEVPQGQTAKFIAYATSDEGQQIVAKRYVAIK